VYKVLGVFIIVLAVALAVVPQMTDCYSQGQLAKLASGMTTPMKCHWTAVSELVSAVPLVGIGAMLSFSRRKQSYMMLSILGVVLAGLAIALPTNLIGTCPTATHVCNTTMKPAILGLGSMLGLTSVVGLGFSFRKEKMG
jgi:hypothetical protein